MGARCAGGPASGPSGAQAAAFLGWAIEAAAGRPPFDFYARVLSRLDAAGRSMRARMLTRLGREAEDALDAFLARPWPPSSAACATWSGSWPQMAASEIEVKREQEDRPGRAGGEVRVMTAHGAKGLEAPIVILPDTTTRAASQGGPLLRGRGRRLPLGAAQGRRLSGLGPRPRPARRGRRPREPAPALCRPDPRARPADHLRGEDARGQLRRQLA